MLDLDNMINSTDRKIFSILLGLSLLSIICVFPYVMTLQGDLLQKIGQPIWLIFMAQFIQSLFLFSIAIFLGLILTNKIGFKLPFLMAIIENGDYRKILNSILAVSVVLGIIIAVIIYGLDNIFTIMGVNISTHQGYAPIWQKLLAAFYGGITEEILMRLFLMTLFIWIGMKLFRQKTPSTPGIIIPIFLAAIVFGLGHLPITASLTKITPLVVGRAVILNGIGGIVFGWLFWKKGLESAIIAHFTTDIFLLTLFPLLLK
jgi:membrane protease YdiL (CAAX protease family)